MTLVFSQSPNVPFSRETTERCRYGKGWQIGKILRSPELILAASLDSTQNRRGHRHVQLPRALV
jgi:hypothetical protein